MAQSLFSAAEQAALIPNIEPVRQLSDIFQALSDIQSNIRDMRTDISDMRADMVSLEVRLSNRISARQVLRALYCHRPLTCET